MQAQKTQAQKTQAHRARCPPFSDALRDAVGREIWRRRACLIVRAHDAQWTVTAPPPPARGGQVGRRTDRQTGHAGTDDGEAEVEGSCLKAEPCHACGPASSLLCAPLSRLDAHMGGGAAAAVIRAWACPLRLSASRTVSRWTVSPLAPLLPQPLKCDHYDHARRQGARCGLAGGEVGAPHAFRSCQIVLRHPPSAPRTLFLSSPRRP